MTEIANWNYIYIEEVSSTNDEAKKYCQIPGQKTVIRTNRQTSGRGRRGRRWYNGKGNLYFSMALEFDLKDLGSLVMVSALSLAQAIEELNDEVSPSLKWPNDVLINNSKLSGILLEKGEGNYMIVGVGVNVATKPKKKKLPYNITTLNENNINCTAEEFMFAYLKKFDQNIDFLGRGGKRALRSEWMKRVCGIGQLVTIRQEQHADRGIFAGIDENLTLLLNQRGKLKKVLVGDIFFGNGDIQ